MLMPHHFLFSVCLAQLVVVPSRTRIFSVTPEYECEDDEFECMNLGQCVPRDQKCDGTPQCDDASDEDSFYAGCIGKNEVKSYENFFCIRLSVFFFKQYHMEGVGISRAALMGRQ